MLFKIKEIVDWFLIPLYFLRGRLPWTLGYYSRKKFFIKQAIRSNRNAAGFELTPGYGIRLDERVVEYPWMFSELPKDYGMRVLDAGSVLNYDYLLDQTPIAQSDLTIFTLSPEKRCYFNRGISYVYGDLRKMIFNDDSFDVICSISTLEHVGLDNSVFHQENSISREAADGGADKVMKEFKRVLRPGGTCLFTVPCGEHSVHSWYQIYDEDMVLELIKVFSPASYEVKFFGYKSDGWYECTYQDIKNATFFDINDRTNYDPDFAAGSRGIACVSMRAK